MPTRRQVIEDALVAEREHLWTDLYQIVSGERSGTPVSPTADIIGDCIERIRVIGEALGYATDWRRLPPPALSWYAMVETADELGLKPLPGHPVDFAIGTFLPLDDVTRKAHRYVTHTGDNPDDFDFSR